MPPDVIPVQERFVGATFELVLGAARIDAHRTDAPAGPHAAFSRSAKVWRNLASLGAITARQ